MSTTEPFDTQERLREALLIQESLRFKEQQARQKNEALLRGLDVLNGSDSTSTLYKDILACLKTLVDFDSAALLVETSENHMTTATCSDDRLEFTRFEAKGALLRALNGRASILHDLAKVKYWPESPRIPDAQPLKAALVVPVRALDTRLVLVCAVELNKKIESSDLELLRDFAPLAAQAVQRAQEIDNLQYLADTMRYQAYYDKLTGLPNRKLFDERLSVSVKQARHKVTLILIDVDNFKRINDTLGHLVGDLLLSEIAFRLSGAVPTNSTIARMGGDEFAILLNDEVSHDELSTICQYVLNSVAQPVYLRNRKITPTLSLGVVCGSLNAAATSNEYLQMADIALYQAKESGRNRFRYFDAELKNNLKREVDIETNLPYAFRDGEFTLYYQPIVESVDGVCNRVEVLIRWMKNNGQLYRPDIFIPIAENTGFIHTLGDWILETALYELSDWLQLSEKNTVCVNLTQSELDIVSLSESVLRRIDMAGIERHQLELELSERFVADAVEEHCMDTIRTLDTEGVTFSFDDFGTGQSSLMHLSKFPGDTLKIDKSFVDDIAHSESQQRLVGGMIEFAHHLKMDTVAEGVETDDQRDLLIAMGCDLLQGYLIARPMPKHEIIQFLDEHSGYVPTLKLASNA